MLILIGDGLVAERTQAFDIDAIIPCRSPQIEAPALECADDAESEVAVRDDR